MTDRAWWTQLDKAWRIELAKVVGENPTDAQLEHLLASRSVTLYVHQGGVLDLAPLERFGQLTELTVTGFKKLDGTAVLGTRSSLRHLTLDKNALASVAFLAGLTGLEHLSLSHNKLTDLAPLAKLTKLQTLDVSFNKLTDLAPLAKLTMLKTLAAHANKVKDLAPLAGLVGLRELQVQDNAFGDLAPLAKLTGLVSLDVSGPFAAGKVKDLTPLARLTKLETLDISCHPKVPDLSPLAGCVALKKLTASVLKGKIAGFPALLGLKHLEQIDTHRDIMSKADQAAFKKRKVDVSLG